MAPPDRRLPVHALQVRPARSSTRRGHAALLAVLCVLATGVARADVSKTVTYTASGAAAETLTLTVSGISNLSTRASASPNVFAFQADFPPYGTSITISAAITLANPWQQTDSAGGYHALTVEMFDDSGTKASAVDEVTCPQRVYTPPSGPPVVQPCPPAGHDPSTLSVSVTFTYEPPQGVPVIYVRYDAQPPTFEPGPSPPIVFAVQIDPSSGAGLESRGDPTDQPNHVMLTTWWNGPPPPPAPPPPPSPDSESDEDVPAPNWAPGDPDPDADDGEPDPTGQVGGACTQPNGCPAPDGPGTCGYSQGLPGFWIDTTSLSPVVRDTDYLQPGPGPAFSMTRTYSTIPGSSRMFGSRWSFAYEATVQAYCSAAVFWSGTGRALVFQRPSACTKAATYPMSYTPPAGVFDQLSEHVEGATRYFRYVEKRTGHMHRFDLSAGAYRLTSITDRNGSTLRVTLNADGTVARVTDAAGHQASFQYDANGRCTAMQTPDGRVATYAYDAQGRLVTSVDLLGVTSTFEYDADGWITRLAAGGRGNAFTYATRRSCQDCPMVKYVTSFTDMAGRLTRLELLFTIGWQTHLLIHAPNNVDRVLVLTNGLPDNAYDSVTQGVPTRFTWDARSLLTSITSPDGLVTRIQYDARGNVTRYEDPRTGVSTYTWDTNDRMTSRRDALGRTWSYVNDATGRLLKTTTPGGRVTEYTRNAAGLVVVENRSGEIWRLDRDAAGRVVAVTDPLGHVATVGYDAAGNLDRVLEPEGVETRITYDANRRPTLATFADGTTRQLAYDACSVVASTDEAGARATVTRDASLLPTATTDEQGRSQAYTYNAAHQLAAVRAGADTVAIGYDSVGRPASISRNQVDGYSVTRDAAGHVLTIADSRGHDTALSYDTAYRLTLITDPDGRTLRSTYDAAGRLASVINGRGTAIARTWTPDGELANVMAGAIPIATYTRDARGRMLSVTDATGTTTWTRDAMGRVTGMRTPTGQEAAFVLDARGHLSSITYPGGFTASYVHDARGRPVKVAFPGGSIAFTYDAAGRLVHQARSNGTETLQRFDRSGLLLRVEHVSGGAPFARLWYVRDSVGRIQDVQALLPDAPAVRPLQNGGPVTFGKTNQVLTAGDNTYTYDGDGNVVSVDGSRPLAASYDAENQLTSMTVGGTTASSQYDGLGRRTILATPAGTRRFAYSPGGQLLWESDGAGAVLARHVYAGRSLVATVLANGQAYFHHLDHRASIVAMTGATGTVVNAYRYGPFGEVTHRREEVPNRFTFVGARGVVDEGHDFFLMNARHYDAATGHFLQKDPAGFAGGPNLYVYALGDPVNLIDPSGMEVQGSPAPPQYSNPNKAAKCLMVAGDGASAVLLLAAASTGGTAIGIVGGILAVDKVVSMMRYAGGKTEQGYDSVGGFIWDVLNPGGDGVGALRQSAANAIRSAPITGVGTGPHWSPAEDPHFPSYGKYTLHP